MVLKYLAKVLLDTWNINPIPLFIHSILISRIIEHMPRTRHSLSNPEMSLSWPKSSNSGLEPKLSEAVYPGDMRLSQVGKFFLQAVLRYYLLCESNHLLLLHSQSFYPISPISLISFCALLLFWMQWNAVVSTWILEPGWDLQPSLNPYLLCVLRHRNQSLETSISSPGK